LDVPTGKVRTELNGQDASVRSLAFRPDGKVLASGLSDTTALLWDVAAAPSPPGTEELGAATRDELGAALAGDDAAKAHAAVWALAANPEPALALLRERLRAAPAIDPKRIQTLIADLDHKEFARREKASEELKKLGAAAEAALRAVLKQPPSTEVR